ncbi:NSFL1 cofactor p47-like [Scleropages formosus]|uniref:NSFL1 cofactor p47 n=1 Tax=Scleropages formosus TaxID=113540 RepID=A0A8C9V754_SCLFO|nr:NSFL1 cofactor p47-like [Scleropages formosus]
MAAQEESVREFVAVTDVDEGRARFFLESAGWDLQVALANFYEDGGDEDVPTFQQPETPPTSRPAAPSQPRVTSFWDLVHEEQQQHSDEDEGQRFYAGGSERSGQQIVGPPKKKSSHEVVEELFRGAKEHGAVPVDRAGKGFGEPSKPFVGGGYRLGATTEERSTYVAGERRSSNSKQEVQVVLKLWKLGFSLDDGDLRKYTDPENADFLETIRRGEIPLELRQLASGGHVNLDMEDHRDEEFCKPKAAFKAFGGEGQKLGSAAAHFVSLASLSGDADAQEASEAQARSAMRLDDTQPVTSIQLRLADGGRLVQKFNHTHRISDVRQFVAAARPAMASVEFVLMTTFPNKELMDESLTLKEANLLNAVIVQQLK